MQPYPQGGGAQPPSMSTPGANPRMPEDQGMTSLGLIMQLLGFVMAIAWLYFLLAMVLGRSGMPGLLILVLLLCIVRAIWGGVAGARLIRGDPRGPGGAAIWAFAALGHSALSAILFAVGIPMFGSTVGIAVLPMFCAWPVVVLVLCLRAPVRSLGAAEWGAVIQARDQGIAGVSVLMLVFGAIGALGSLVAGVGLVSAIERGGTLVALLLVSVLLLVVRSGFHVAAGVRGLLGSTADFHAATARYVGLGIAAAGVFLGCFLLGSIGSGGGLGLILAIFVGGSAMGMLLVWPLSVSKLRQQILLRTMGDGLPPARDGGLTALGILVLGMSAFGAATVIGKLIAGTGFGASSFLGRSALGGAEALPVWANAISAAVGVWAGVELCFMTPRYRTAGLVYGAVGIVLGLWGVIDYFGSSGGALRSVADLGSMMGPMVLIGTGIGLVIPIVTLALSLRPIPEALEDAVARHF